ncbi:hypothetical protein GYH30_044169 [Glycine max]|uniref:Rad21/Rec8-like protein C-terminal eukaryotic domain-containing protein n=1 Tax=Glycine soja TaxID=3848 RepID=A0A445GEI5_GLYSO|nr:hypothetical protein GYH30_044169 [Glycine max]RZB59632.1 hypothetical protein D0Y65_042727 [Glycine soja]
MTDAYGKNLVERGILLMSASRKVASCLHQTRKQREEDRINFHKFLEAGRAPKEPALLFYEVLVLKTTGYVDVEQNEAYGDIAISKLPKLDQTFLFDGLYMKLEKKLRSCIYVCTSASNSGSCTGTNA